MTSAMGGTLVTELQYIHILGYLMISMIIQMPKNCLISSGVVFVVATAAEFCETSKFL